MRFFCFDWSILVSYCPCVCCQSHRRKCAWSTAQFPIPPDHIGCVRYYCVEDCKIGAKIASVSASRLVFVRSAHVLFGAIFGHCRVAAGPYSCISLFFFVVFVILAILFFYSATQAVVFAEITFCLPSPAASSPGHRSHVCHEC